MTTDFVVEEDSASACPLSNCLRDHLSRLCPWVQATTRPVPFRRNFQAFVSSNQAVGREADQIPYRSP